MLNNSIIPFKVVTFLAAVALAAALSFNGMALAGDNIEKVTFGVT